MVLWYVFSCIGGAINFMKKFVLLSIFLRQKGSPQSKPIDAANDETGD